MAVYKLGGLTIIPEADVLDSTNTINAPTSSQYNSAEGVSKVVGQLYIQESATGAFTLITPMDTTPTGEWKEISMGASDFLLDVAAGNIAGHSSVNKFGRNPDIDTGVVEDVWGHGGLWVPPTAPRVHNIASSSIADVGVVKSTGTFKGSDGTLYTAIDTDATFVSDGVVVGDVVLNDSTMGHSIIQGVTETTLTIHKAAHDTVFVDGESYRVVNASSTGASIVHVYGLDTDMLPVEEFVVLNGTTVVPTVRPYWRMHRMHTDGAAARTVTNVGSISATAVVDGTVTCEMGIGNGTTTLAVYTVPAGKTAYMTQLYASINKQGGTGGAMADLSLRSTAFASTDGAGSRSDHYFGLAVDGTSNYDHQFKPYRKFEEQTDIWIRCDSVTDNNTDISAGFDLILVDKT